MYLDLSYSEYSIDVVRNRECKLKAVESFLTAEEMLSKDGLNGDRLI
jgi:hypothetical protein